MAQKVNWDEIRSEYIQGGVAYRVLAAKFGVALRTVAERGRREKWVLLRAQCHDKTVAKTVETIAKQNAKVDNRINRLATRLIEKLETAVEELDKKTVSMKSTQKTEQEEVVSEYRQVDMNAQAPVDRAGIRQLTACLKDLKAIMDVRSELDRQEQQARIEKLRHDAREEASQDRTVTVILEGELNDFAQ